MRHDPIALGISLEVPDPDDWLEGMEHLVKYLDD